MTHQLYRCPQGESHIQNSLTPVQNTKFLNDKQAAGPQLWTQRSQQQNAVQSRPVNDKRVSTFHFTQLQAEEGLHFPIQSRPINEKRIPIVPFHPTPSRRGCIFQSNQGWSTTSAPQYLRFTKLQAEEGLHFPIQSRPMNDKRISILPFHPTPNWKRATFSNPIKTSEWQAHLNTSISPDSKQKKGYIFQAGIPQTAWAPWGLNRGEKT